MHGRPHALFFRLACLLALVSSALAVADPLSAAVENESAVGLSTAFLQEAAGRLELPEVMAAYQAGQFTPGKSPVLNFGIGAKPVWIHLAVDNPTAQPLDRRLSIENAWLDSIDAYFVRHGATVSAYHVGDRQVFAQRPLWGRYFAFDEAFAPGTTDVFIRVETPDPMVVPVYLLSRETFRVRETQQELSYGIVYGFLLALMAYNTILYASLRSARYLSYALYLGMFITMNVSYTGHGFAWLWPDSVNWQQWSNPILMFLYAASGLFFANRFLGLRTFFPPLHKAVAGYCAVFGVLLAVAILAGSQKQALLVSFSFVFLFTGIMLGLGIIAVRAGQKPATYFLIAAVAAMAGAVLTTLSTWGFIPHNSWTFRAVEGGMLADATLLALALAYQFRVGQEERLRAVQLAQLDPLTGLNNRRAFYDKSGPQWSNAARHRHDLSVMLLDIDLFKQINDTRGHAYGDEVLKGIAGILRQRIRQGDVLARWGGEEFIVLMPETGLQDALVMAERLREAIAGMHIPHEAGASVVTASFGVALAGDRHLTLDALIASADECLYQSKLQGRNRVTGCSAKRCPGRASESAEPPRV